MAYACFKKESMNRTAKHTQTTAQLDQLSAEVARLHLEVAQLRLEREQDMEDIRTATAMAEMVLWTHKSVDDQEITGYRPAGSHEQLGSVEVAVGGVEEGQKPLHGDALN